MDFKVPFGSGAMLHHVMGCTEVQVHSFIRSSLQSALDPCPSTKNGTGTKWDKDKMCDESGNKSS